MGAGSALLAGVAAAVVIAGCGGGGHAASTSSSASIATTGASASPVPGGIRSRLLGQNELAGFRSSGVTVYKTASSWLSSEQGVPPNQVAAERAMLARDGFSLAAREDLMSGGKAGLSLVEQFRSPAAARDAFRLYAAQFKAPGAPGGAYAPFSVPGVPGAVGFSLGGASGGGINIAFTDGDYYYLVGQEGASPTAIANLNAAAQHLYRRVHT
jgi:hypothetical protein